MTSRHDGPVGGGLDVLMVTHDRPGYTALSLPRLLGTVPPDGRVWVWHNGGDRRVLDVISSHLTHPRLHRVHRSTVNVGLRPALNWLWLEARGRFVSKVDDDSLMQPGWAQHLGGALDAWDGFGVMGSWRFRPEDWDETVARQKIVTHHGVQLLRNHWVQGSGHVLRRDLVAELGPLRPGESFVGWCLRSARSGYVNGWPLPLVVEEHLDDPRHPLTAFVDEEAYRASVPLSARVTGATTLAEWLEQTRQDAAVVQRATLDLRWYGGWQRRLVHLRRRLKGLRTGKRPWTEVGPPVTSRHGGLAGAPQTSRACSSSRRSRRAPSVVE